MTEVAQGGLEQSAFNREEKLDQVPGFYSDTQSMVSTSHISENGTIYFSLLCWSNNSTSSASVSRLTMIPNDSNVPKRTGGEVGLAG